MNYRFLSIVFATCFLFSSYLSAPSLYAQTVAAAVDSTFHKAKTFEIGLNVTSTISSFLGSGETVTPDPYIFSAKWVKGKHGIRTGFNLQLANNTEQGTDISGTRHIREVNFKMRGGYEHRIYVSKRFDLFYGIDIVGLYAHSEVDFESPGNDPAFLRSSSYGIGTGPILGLMFHINKRLALSTESTLYGIFTHTREREFAPPVTSATNSNQFQIVPTLPSSLYFIVKF